ncbi:MAG: hypothetical protein A4E32_00769 [Methanomassiliicoccales archaeon PtaU1.Bin124]|nr:MAG: hypothetical protein A4E32_00769 [Methanomassiliicoccales archaeon PtaU1.Bin124]
MSLTLRLIPGLYAVCRLPKDHSVPDLPKKGLLSITWTDDELSIICLEESIPAGSRAYKGYRCLMLNGPFPAETVGVLESVLRPLAQAGVFIMAFSTFDTDYVLVPEIHLGQAMAALGECGIAVTL